jgi:hypothetical protein
MAPDQEYRSYLLRLWKVSDNHERWQAMLEKVDSGERRGFSSLQALFDYLQQVTHTPAGAQERRVNGEDREGEP